MRGRHSGRNAAPDFASLNPGYLLTLKRACHPVRVSCYDRQQHLGRLVGTVRALLPIPHGAERQVKPRGEFLLRQVQPLTQRAHARHAPRAGKLRCGRRPRVRVRKRGAVAVLSRSWRRTRANRSSAASSR